MLLCDLVSKVLLEAEIAVSRATRLQNLGQPAQIERGPPDVQAA